MSIPVKQTTRSQDGVRSTTRPSVPGHAHPAVSRVPQSWGNQALQRMLRSGAIQAKLTVNQPGDSYEREADRVADQVMRMPAPTLTGTSQGSSLGQRVQRKCAHCEEELQRRTLPGPEEEPDLENIPVYDDPNPDAGAPEGEEEGGGEFVGEEGEVQLKALSSPTPQPSQAFANHLTARRGGGQPLDAGARSFMESRFGTDFGAVRVHTDAGAGEMTRHVQAAAFTHGRDVYFGSGQYNPDTSSGRRLLAHELTHVLQQNGRSEVQRSRVSVSTGATPAIQRRREADINLDKPHRVRVSIDARTPHVFNPVSGGAATIPLIGKSFKLSKRSNPTAKIGKWGLQYFCPFHGGIGFHSNIAYPKMSTLCDDGSKLCDRSVPQDTRKQVRLVVDGTARSHGCIRMLHADARKFYDLVRERTAVRVYREKSWRKPSWSTP